MDNSSSASMSQKASTETGHRRHRWSLTFVQPNIENAFLQGRRDKMFLNLSRCAALVTTMNLISLAQLVMGAGAYQYDEATAYSLRVFYICYCSIFGASAVAMRLPCVTKHLSVRVGEALSTLFVLSLLAAELIFRTLGTRNLSEELRLTKTMSTALVLDAIVTVSHLALPTRWFITVWSDAIFIVSYAAFHQTLNSGSYQGDISSILVLTGLVCGANFGVHSQEKSERAMFTTIVDERTLRAQAEHSAEVRQKKRPKAESITASDGQVTSTPSTTETGALFRQVKGCELLQRSELLEDVEELGRREQWLIERDHLVQEPIILGEGGQAKVVVGSLSFGLVAIKMPKKRPLNKRIVDPNVPLKPGYSSTMWDELRILRHVRHPHIALFHGACIQSEGVVWLVMEIVHGKVLNEFLIHWSRRWQVRRHESARSGIVQGVCEALAYLHSLKPCVVHGDLKPSNIKVDLRGEGPFAKLLDFGLARTVTRHDARGCAGTKYYMAPELRNSSRGGSRADPAVDIFSLGVLLQVLATGELPEEKGVSYWSPSRALQEAWAGVMEVSLREKPEARPPIWKLTHTLSGALGGAFTWGPGYDPQTDSGDPRLSGEGSGEAARQVLRL